MTHEALEWDKRARALEFDQLVSLRRAAEQWRNGLGALTGTLATVALLKGADSFSDLTSTGQVVAMLSLGTAFALLVIGALCAMRAAFSQPSQIINAGEDLRRWTEDETRCSARYLRAAQIITPVALLFLAAGVATTWVGTAASNPGSLVVDLDDGTRTCGTVDRSGGGELVLLVGPAPAEGVRIDLEDVRSLATAEGC